MPAESVTDSEYKPTRKPEFASSQGQQTQINLIQFYCCGAKSQQEYPPGTNSQLLAKPVSCSRVQVIDLATREKPDEVQPRTLRTASYQTDVLSVVWGGGAAC